MANIAATLDASFPSVAGRTPLNTRVVAVAGSALALGAIYLGGAVGWRQAALLLVGAGAGVVLYHAAFGFTTAWRVLISDARGAGVRAQMLMLAVTCAIFVPILASGQLYGQAVRGNVSPLGTAVVVGAFLFGIGMQLGGGCASGTLYTVGGGSSRMVVTLASFVAGSAIGAAHMHWWDAAPALPGLSLLATFGAVTALVITFAMCGAMAYLTTFVERRRHGVVAANPASPRTGVARLMQGPWSMAAGALGLAAVNVATLALAGRPWGVTSAFALWGSQILGGAGVDVASWPYWSSPARAAELQASVVNDITSVMDFGILLGALGAAGLAGKFKPTWRVPARSLAAAVLGGLLLGYGARLAYGCNIGAYFSGIASTSLHGWLWMVAAFAGNVVGTRMRPAFGLRVEGKTS